MGKITILIVTVFLFISPLHAQENKQASFSLLMERWGSPGLFLLMGEIIIKGEDPEEFNWTMKGAAMKQQLEWLPEEIVSSFNVLLPTALNDNNRPEIHGLIRQAFAKEKMRSILEQEFNEAFDEQQAGKVAEWLDTEVAEHVLSAQFEANSFQGIQNAMGYRYKGNKLKRMVSMNKLGAIQRRLHLYWDHGRQYINYAGLVVSTERVTGYGIRKYEKVLNGLVIFEPKERQIAMIRRYLIPYTYRDLSDAELAEYLQFMNSDVGRKLHTVMNRGIRKAIERAYIDLIAALEVVYRRNHPNSVLPY